MAMETADMKNIFFYETSIGRIGIISNEEAVTGLFFAGEAEIAKSIGQPKACRAVGMANNRNPLAVMVPCHSVIGTNGKLVEYAGGLSTKQKLLELEKKYGNRI